MTRERPAPRFWPLALCIVGLSAATVFALEDGQRGPTAEPHAAIAAPAEIACSPTGGPGKTDDDHPHPRAVRPRRGGDRRLWPLGPWMAGRTLDPSGEPWGLLALVLAALVVHRSLRDRATWCPSSAWLALASVLLIAYAATWSHLPRLASAILGAGALGATILHGLPAPERRSRVGLLGLVVLALPSAPPSTSTGLPPPGRERGDRGRAPRRRAARRDPQRNRARGGRPVDLRRPRVLGDPLPLDLGPPRRGPRHLERARRPPADPGRRLTAGLAVLANGWRAAALAWPSCAPGSTRAGSTTRRVSSPSRSWPVR